MSVLYEANGNVYEVEGGVVYPANITAKDKVIEIRELESVSVKHEKEAVELPAIARPVTIDEVIAKFNISEKHPCKFDKSAHEECFAELEEDNPNEQPEGSDANESVSDSEAEQKTAKKSSKKAAKE